MVNHQPEPETREGLEALLADLYRAERVMRKNLNSVNARAQSLQEVRRIQEDGLNKLTDRISTLQEKIRKIAEEG